MQIIGILTSFIYILSSALLFPVLFLLSLLTVVTLYQLGRFSAEFVSRRKFKSSAHTNPDIANFSFRPASAYVFSFIQKMEALLKGRCLREVEVEYLLQENSWRLRKSLDILQILVRVGPMLGLMGTLIPMGTGLAALSQGDMTRLSSDLVIAFTTTVVGLAEGGIAYAILSVKKRWLELDILQMEYIAEEFTGRNIEKKGTSDALHEI